MITETKFLKVDVQRAEELHWQLPLVCYSTGVLL
jgi:hypothetical protein